MLHIIYSILPIFLVIFIGFLAKQFTVFNKNFWAGCAKLAYYVFFPALLLNAIITTNLNDDIHRAIIPLVIVTCVFAFTLLILQWLFKFNGKTFSSVFQAIVRYNSYIFIGVSLAVYGHQSLPIVAIIIAYMIIITNILSVIVLSIYASHEKINFGRIAKGIIKNPLVLSCIIATLWNKLGVPYPSLLQSTLTDIGGAALPVSLMCVGAGLQFNNLLENLKLILLVDFIKLIIFPVAVAFVLNYFHCTGLTKHIAITYSLVPTAGNAYILAKQMDGDHETMSTLICSMVVFSIITIPVLLHYLH